MITLKDYNLELIRDFSSEQFDTHIKLLQDIANENDFGKTGVQELLGNYLQLLSNIQKDIENGIKEFRLSREEVVLYDIIVELARLCYKHSYETSEHNDWEEEF